MTDDILRVEGLVKRFGSVTALRGATLSVRPAAITAIVGDNGAGKSTLIKCVTGVHRPDEGSILIEGAPAGFRDPADSRRAGIECVYQDLALADDLAIWQNLFLNRERVHSLGPIRILDRRRMRREAEELLATKLDVRMPSVRARVRRLSGGQRQAVAICRAAGFGSRVVILDEPSAALGARETERAERLITGLRDEGLAVLLISHDFAQVERLADHVYIMRGGHVTAARHGAEVTAAGLVALVTGASG
jgi:simple sugar transport system ATP-binding protein